MISQEETSVLRWGGILGMLGALLLIFVFVFVAVVVGEDPDTLEGPLTRYPEISTQRIVENGLYLMVFVLWIPFSLALYRALRRSNPAAALFGSGLSISGLIVLAAGALPHVAAGSISDLYHAPGTTAADQTTLELIWQTNQSLNDAYLVVGTVLITIGLLAFGMAMLADRQFSGRLGWVNTGLAAAGILGAAVFLIDPASPSVLVVFLVLIAFHLGTGWKLYALSQTPADVVEHAEPPRVYA